MPRQCRCQDYYPDEKIGVEPFHGGTRCVNCHLWVDRPPEPEGGWRRLVVRVHVPKLATTNEQWPAPFLPGDKRIRYMTKMAAQQEHLNVRCPMESMAIAARVLDGYCRTAYADCTTYDNDGYPSLDYVRARLVEGEDGVWILDRDFVAVELTVTILELPNQE